MITVTVYSTGPHCQRCRLTCQRLQDAGIPFSLVDITADANSDLRTFLTDDLGYTEAPVVIVDDEPQNHWSGLRPDLIDRLADRIREDTTNVSLPPDETLAEAGERIRLACPIVGLTASDRECRERRAMITETLEARGVIPGASVWNTAQLVDGRIVGVFAQSVEEAELDLTVWWEQRCHWVIPDADCRVMREYFAKGKRSAAEADRRFPLAPPRRVRDQFEPAASLLPSSWSPTPSAPDLGGR